MARKISQSSQKWSMCWLWGLEKTFNSRVFVESTTPGREHTHTHLIALTIDRSDWIISEISRGKRPYFPVPFLNGSFHFFKWRTVQVLSLVTGLFSAHVPMLIHHPQLQHPKGHVYITGHFSCITEHIVYCLLCTKCTSIVYIGDTGCRLADHFREHRRDIINRRNNLPVPAYFNQPNHTMEDMKVVVLKAGLANQDYRKKQEMRLIFNYGTVGPKGLNQDFSFTWITPLLIYTFSAYLRAVARYFMWHAREYATRHVS